MPTINAGYTVPPAMRRLYMRDATMRAFKIMHGGMSIGDSMRVRLFRGVALILN